MRNGQGVAGQAAIVGIGETRYGKRGALNDVTEFSLCLDAIQKAAADAGVGRGGRLLFLRLRAA